MTKKAQQIQQHYQAPSFSTARTMLGWTGLFAVAPQPVGTRVPTGRSWHRNKPKSTVYTGEPLFLAGMFLAGWPLKAKVAASQRG